MTLIVFCKHFIGVDADSRAHAVPFTIKADKTHEAVCGASVDLYGVRTCVQRNDEWVEDVAVMSWPPRVARWKEINGGTRCADCYAQTGKPRPDSGFGGVEPADEVFGPCDKLREDANA